MRGERLSDRKQSVWAGLEVLDEAPHGAFKTAQAVRFGLLQSLLILPVIVGYPVAREDGPSAIGPAPAVYEHRPAVAVFQNAQDLGNLLLRGRAQAMHGNADKAHPIGLDDLLFVGNIVFAGPAQIDHSLDPAFGQLLESFVGGLPAAKYVIVDNFEIRQTVRTLRERRGGTQNGDNNCTDHDTLSIPRANLTSGRTRVNLSALVRYELYTFEECSGRRLESATAPQL